MHSSSSFFSVIGHAFCVLLGNLCLLQGGKYFPSVLFSGKFMVPTFTFRSYDAFQVNFCVWYEVRKRHGSFSFLYMYLVVPASLAEKMFLSSLNGLSTSVENQFNNH